MLGPALFLEPEEGEGQPGRGWAGLSGLDLPASEEALAGRRELPLSAPTPKRSGKGGGHPASLSLAQLHFQKFFLLVRGGKKSLGSLSGCREGGGQVGTRFPRDLTGQAGAVGPPAWAKGPAQPWYRGWAPARGVRRTDQ